MIFIRKYKNWSLGFFQTVQTIISESTMSGDDENSLLNAAIMLEADGYHVELEHDAAGRYNTAWFEQKYDGDGTYGRIWLIEPADIEFQKDVYARNAIEAGGHVYNRYLAMWLVAEHYLPADWQED